MPVKNTAKYLPECIDSIISQDFKNWELIAVNDHSEDNSLEILKQYAKKDSRIKFFKNKDKGIIPALQLAYSKSSGKYLTRMDSDDICKKEKLSVLHQKLIEFGTGHIAIGQVEYFSENELGEGYKKYADWLNQLTEKGNNFEGVFKECVIPSPCWMLHKSDFEACGAFSSEVYPEDYDLCFRIYHAGLKCIPCNKPLHLWRDRPNRTSRTDSVYADNHFSELKINHFIKGFLSKEKQLVLWGAGNRGKKIAKLLNALSINYKWICNNPNKIGLDIYGQKLMADTDFPYINNPQVIVCVANEAAKEEILQKFTELDLKNMEDYYFFS